MAPKVGAVFWAVRKRGGRGGEDGELTGGEGKKTENAARSWQPPASYGELPLASLSNLVEALSEAVIRPLHQDPKLVGRLVFRCTSENNGASCLLGTSGVEESEGGGS